MDRLSMYLGVMEPKFVLETFEGHRLEAQIVESAVMREQYGRPLVLTTDPEKHLETALGVYGRVMQYITAWANMEVANSDKNICGLDLYVYSWSMDHLTHFNITSSLGDIVYKPSGFQSFPKVNVVSIESIATFFGVYDVNDFYTDNETPNPSAEQQVERMKQVIDKCNDMWFSGSGWKQVKSE